MSTETWLFVHYRTAYAMKLAREVVVPRLVNRFLMTLHSYQ
jgi:hypothetical protein